MKDAKAIRQFRTRLPAAKRYDRNCVLAATAGQIIAANTLGLKVDAIIVGDTPFDVGKVASDIRLAKPEIDAKTSLVAMAGIAGFGLAAGLTADEIRSEFEGIRQAAVDTAINILQPWIDNGRYARLVRALDAYQFAGTRRLQ